MAYNKFKAMSNNNPGETLDAVFWHALFKADSIAVIGAKNTAGTWGHNIIKAAMESVKAKAERRVYPVNPNIPEVQGIRSYTSVLDIPGPVELAIVVVPAPSVPQVFRECAEKKIKAAVIITAGFSEVDEDGARLQADILSIARQAGMHFTGPNCNGHADLHSRVGSVSYAIAMPAGPLALLSQSGTLGITIMLTAVNRGIGLSKFVSTGNEADLHLEDYLEYLARDEETHIIAAYIEGLREGRRFYELAKEITREKPIVVMKSGTTGASAQAAKSHTGALSGADNVYATAFKQAGVIRAEDEGELCDIVLALHKIPLPRGNRIAILTVGGGFGVVAAEACEKEGLEISPLEPQTIKKLSAVLPSRWVPGNPVDLVGILPGQKDNPGDICLQYLLEDKNVDAIISLQPPMMLPPEMMGNTSPEQIRAMQQEIEKNQENLYRQMKQYGKPLVYIRRLTFRTGQESSVPAPKLKIMMPEYSHPRRAARVLGLLAEYRRYLEQS
jgi:acyl-CoA synthetase (NDP forming)